MALRKAKKKRVTRKKATQLKKTRRRVGAKRSSPTRKRAPTKKRAVTKKRKPRKRRRKKAPQPKVLKAVERVSVERTLAGKRRKKRRSKPKPRARSRRRKVSGKGSGLLVGLAIGAGAYLLLSNMNKTPTYPSGYTGGLNNLIQTQNQTRNTQSQDILNYAMAAGLAANAIASLIERLNTSSDSDVKQIYDHVSTTGDVGVWV